MDDKTLRTSADELYEIVESKKKISVEEAAKLLKVPVKTTQALVDFLVEEKIFGIEYKFTTPYVYISREKQKDVEFQSTPQKKIITKEDFFRKADEWNVPSEKINYLWKKYVQENIGYIREEFYSKAQLRKLPRERIEVLWKKYLPHLQ